MKLKVMAVGLFLFSCLYTVNAQKFVNGSELELIGKMFPDEPGYSRLDTTKWPDLPDPVKSLLQHSAGLALSFSTNSNKISAKWCVGGAGALNNMTPIGQKGLDLYIRRNGKWEYAGVGRPKDKCSSYTLIENMEDGWKECLVYLPLYDELKSIEIGIDEDAQIRKHLGPFKKRILVYGSSIVHGASAARPGIAYPARLSRNTGYQFINFGVSGSAKMEASVAKLIASVQADIYVLDCVPNSNPEVITERTANLVKTIRAAHPNAPIVMIESIVRESGNFDTKIAAFESQKNINFKIEYEKLIAEDVKGLYYIEGKDLIGHDHEGTTDGIHPNDLGFDRMVQIIEPVMRKVIAEIEK